MAAKATDILLKALDTRGRSQSWLATKTNVSTSTWHMRLKRDNMKADDFLEAMEALGYVMMPMDRYKLDAEKINKLKGDRK